MKRYSFNLPMCPTCAGLRAHEHPDGKWMLVADHEAAIALVTSNAIDQELEDREHHEDQLAAANALLERAEDALRALGWAGGQPTVDIRAHLAQRSSGP